MKNREKALKDFFIVCVIIVTVCVFFLAYTLLCKRDIKSAAPWASATGSLAAALVALSNIFIQADKDEKTKSKEMKAKNDEMNSELQRLVTAYFELKSADGYASNNLGKYSGDPTFFDFWRLHLYSLEILKEALQKSNCFEASDEVASFIEFLHDDKNKSRTLNSQVAAPLLKLRKIIEDKQEQLKNLNADYNIE